MAMMKKDVEPLKFASNACCHRCVQHLKRSKLRPYGIWLAAMVIFSFVALSKLFSSFFGHRCAVRSFCTYKMRESPFFCTSSCLNRLIELQTLYLHNYNPRNSESANDVSVPARKFVMVESNRIGSTRPRVSQVSRQKCLNVYFFAATLFYCMANCNNSTAHNNSKWRHKVVHDIVLWECVNYN